MDTKATNKSQHIFQWSIIVLSLFATGFVLFQLFYSPSAIVQYIGIGLGAIGFLLLLYSLIAGKADIDIRPPQDLSTTSNSEADHYIQLLKTYTPQFAQQYQQYKQKQLFFYFLVLPGLAATCVIIFANLWVKTTILFKIIVGVLVLFYLAVARLNIKNTHSELDKRFLHLSRTIEIASQFREHGELSEQDSHTIDFLLLDAEELQRKVGKGLRFLG